jgi:CRP-like cAMP-binding protein
VIEITVDAGVSVRPLQQLTTSPDEKVMQESLYLNLDKDVAKTVIDFFSGFRSLQYQKGEIITRSDAPNAYVYCTQSGFVVSYSISPKGQRDIHMISGTSTMFPISNFWIPKKAKEYLPARTVYFEALSDVVVLQAPDKEFTEFVWSKHEAQLALFKQFCLNHRIHMTRLEMMQIRDVRLKLMSLLLILGMNMGVEKAEGCIIQAPISHQILADCLSVARETTSRELRKLKAEGLINYYGGCIELTNIRQLKEMVEDY